MVVIPDGKDPDEFIKKNGPDRFRALLEGAVSDIEYNLLTAAKDINLESEDGRLRYLSAAAEIVAKSDDVMTRDIYIGRLSEKYGVSRTALNSKVEEIRKKNIRTSKKKEISDILRPKFTKDDINPERRRSPKGTAAEETLIAVLIKNPDFYKRAKEKLPPEKLITSLNRRIYEMIISTLDSGGSLDISVFAQKLLPAEVGYIVSLQNSEKACKNPEIVLKDCIRVILEEDTLLSAQSPENTSVEEWADAIKTIIDKKSKGKK